MRGCLVKILGDNDCWDLLLIIGYRRLQQAFNSQ